MSVESVFNRFNSLNKTIGKRALNALFPNDVELYVIALELVNSDNETEAYFIFPITPSSISENIVPIKTIKKTAGGTTVLKTTTFSHTDITLQGNFGRNFKILLGKEVISFAALKFTPSISKPTIAEEFDISIKNGYGCYKVLESIFLKSNTLDAKGKPYALFFYNLSLGNSYMAEGISLTPSQNLDSNMIWNYTLQLKSLIPIEDITDQSQLSLTQSLSANSAIQDQTNSIANEMLKIIL